MKSSKRRHFFLTALGLGTAMAVAAACGFPDPTIDDDAVRALTEGGGGGEGGNADVLDVPDGPVGDATSEDPRFFPETAPPLDPDATSAPPDAGPCTNPCDCDKDGYETADATTRASASCTGMPLDCDDTDSRANPDAGFSGEFATQTTLGNWNCRSGTERKFPVNYACSLLSGSACIGAGGFTGDPACGVYGEYQRCKQTCVLGAVCLCGADGTDTRQQLCQ